jgi:hypothetical protein
MGHLFRMQAGLGIWPSILPENCDRHRRRGKRAGMFHAAGASEF